VHGQRLTHLEAFPVDPALPEETTHREIPRAITRSLLLDPFGLT